jgi:hypothetical protein
MLRLGPFPGMDPWLESRWSGFHHLLISHIQALLNPQVRPLGLLARIEDRVYVESIDGSYERCVRPDVFVIRSPTPETIASEETGLVATAVASEPYIIQWSDEPPTIGTVEIIDAANEAKVVTAVEVLSPTNKIDPRARREYAQKREEYRAGHVNTVEIDLLRDGHPLWEMTLDRIPPHLRTPYATCVRREWGPRGPTVEYYAMPFRSQLPGAIKVPLRDSEPDVRLDLQAAFNAAFDQGSYEVINYDKPPVPPLGTDDMAWAHQRVEHWRAARRTEST